MGRSAIVRTFWPFASSTAIVLRTTGTAPGTRMGLERRDQEELTVRRRVGQRDQAGLAIGVTEPLEASTLASWLVA